MNFLVEWEDRKGIKYCKEFENSTDTATFVVGLFNYKDVVKINVFDKHGNLVDIFEEEEEL